MSALHGKNAYVAFLNAAGTLVPLSTYFKTAAVNRSIDHADVSAFQQSAKTFVLGMNDETVDFSGHFDVALHTHMVALMIALDNGTLATCTVVIGPAGNATGMVKTQRECLVKSYNWSASIGGEITAAVNFQRTGPNSDSVF